MTEVQFGDVSHDSNAGYVRRLRLVPLPDVLWVANPVRYGWVGGGIEPQAADVVYKEDATVFGPQLLPRTARVSEQLTTSNQGLAYEISVAMEFPRPSASMIQWLQAYAEMEWVVLWEDYNDSAWLSGTHEKGLRMQWSRTAAAKNMLTLTLYGRFAVASCQLSEFGDVPGVSINLPGGYAWVQQAVAQIIGTAGWTPLISVEEDGARRVLYVFDHIGGGGPKPATGYVGVNGLVTDIADGVNIAGAAGSGTGTNFLNYPEKTKAEMRAIVFDPTDPASTIKPAYYVINMDKIFKFNALETGADDDSTILVDLSNNRWTLTTPYDDLYSPNR